MWAEQSHARYPQASVAHPLAGAYSLDFARIRLIRLIASDGFQPRPALVPAFQPLLVANHIVASHGEGMLVTAKLDLHIVHPAVTERAFRAREIELPHPAEALVIKALSD